MPKKIESTNLIVKSNDLIEANYRLTALEQKIIHRLIMTINKNDEDFKDYRFRVAEFMELAKTSDKTLYKSIQQTTYSLLGKRITIHDKDSKRLLQVCWLSSADYHEGEGFVDLHFDPKLKPFLLKLQECFTSFDSSNVMQLRSSYSIRIYELLRQYQKVGERIITVEDIRKKLGIQDTEYKQYNDFKRFVILQAQKELSKKTDISFDFEEIKGSRKKVIAIKFIIQSKKKTVQTIEDVEQLTLEQTTATKHVPSDSRIQKNAPVSQDAEEIIAEFRKLYNAELNFACTQKMIEQKGIEHVKECLYKYSDVSKGRNIRNVAGDFFTCVVRGYIEPVPKKGQIGYAEQKFNFEQRKYTDEEYEGFYTKLDYDES